MLRMTEQINKSLLTEIPSRADPRVEVDCVTCHRGLPLPKTLQTTMFEIVNKDGASAAVERYRALRRDQTLTGRYNFGEWEINELARRLVEADNTAAGIAILEMNGEFYPKSADIDFQLGELHRMRGDHEQAVKRYRAALEKAPQHLGAKRRLEELEKR
jgi:lipopolysaccharide biosynthesis regulator YciM